MKMKTLVATVAASLLATSMAFAAATTAATAAAPADMAGADDPMNVATADANPAGLNSTGTTTTGSSENMLASNGSSNASAPTPIDGGNANDDMSADTATGDDDY